MIRDLRPDPDHGARPSLSRYLHQLCRPAPLRANPQCWVQAAHRPRIHSRIQGRRYGESHAQRNGRQHRIPQKRSLRTVEVIISTWSSFPGKTKKPNLMFKFYFWTDCSTFPSKIWS